MPGIPPPHAHAVTGTATQDTERTARPEASRAAQRRASTIVNVRLPLPLVAQLDRYLDRLEWQTGLKANRGMIMRRALRTVLGHRMPQMSHGRHGLNRGIVVR